MISPSLEEMGNFSRHDCAASFVYCWEAAMILLASLSLPEQCWSASDPESGISWAWVEFSAGEASEE